MLVKLYRGLSRRGDGMISMVQLCYNYFRSRTDVYEFQTGICFHVKKTCLFKEGDLLSLLLKLIIQCSFCSTL